MTHVGEMGVRPFVDAFNMRPILPDATLQSCITEALLQLATQNAVRVVSDLFLLLLSDAGYVRRQLVQRVMSGSTIHGIHTGYTHPVHARDEVTHFLDEFTAYTAEVLCGGSAHSRVQRVSDLLQLTSSNSSDKAQGAAVSVSSSSLDSSYAIGCAALDRLFAHASGPSSSDDAEEPSLFMSSSTPNSNTTCGGGFAAGWVTEVAGEAGTGKTQMLLQVLLQSLAETQAAQTLLDTLTEEEKEAKKELNGCTHSAAAAGVALVKRVLQRTARPRAALYLAAEDIPAARLASLAAGAVARVRSAALRHSLLTALPSTLYTQLRNALHTTLTPERVLGKLQVKSIASLHELLRLLRSGTLHNAVRLWGEGHGGVVALDSVAAAAHKATSLSRGKDTSTVHDAVYRESSSEPRSHSRSSTSSGSTMSTTGTRACMRGSSNNKAGLSYDESALLREVGVWLRALAAKEHVCVLVANQVRAIPVDLVARYTPLKRRRDYGKEVNAPALGITWATTPHVRVLLRRGPSGVRQMTLLACPTLPPAQHTFVITQHGIEADEDA